MAPSPPAMPLSVPSAKGDKASRIASLHGTQHHGWEAFTARWATAACVRDTRMLDAYASLGAQPGCTTYSKGSTSVMLIWHPCLLTRSIMSAATLSRDQGSLLHQQRMLGVKKGKGIILPTWQHTALHYAKQWQHQADLLLERPWTCSLTQGLPA